MSDRPAPVVRPPVSAIIHGLRWPDARTRDTLRARLSETLPGVEILEAHEDPSACIGAAALMARAAERARGQILLFLEPSILPGVEDLRALIAAAERGIAMVDDGYAQRAKKENVAVEAIPGDLLARLALRTANDGSIVGAPATAEGSGTSLDSHTPTCAIARDAYDALGGLDARLWSIGIADDLSARAALAGIPVRYLPAAGDSTAAVVGPPAYPLRDAVARLLAVRNPLLIAFKTAAADEFGDALAAHATDVLLASWEATGLGPDAFTFGGSWGRNTSWLKSLVQQASGRTTPDVPLRDPEGCLLPLLAIDSVLDELDASLDERRAWARTARDHERDHEREQPHDEADDTAHASPLPASGAREASADPAATGSASAVAVAAAAAPPRVSVIVVNWNGRIHLRDCFGSLERSDYPADRLELICVDNGSTDGSVDLLRAEFPRVRIVALDRNTGFTGGNEAGVRIATGDVLLFLNNDMRVEPDCVRELVGALDAECACAGARVLSWDGAAIDFVRGSLNFEGRGFQDFYGLPNLPELATPTETFFPNGGAFAVTRDAYDRAGGFDPSFFAYYDDVDLGWRLRLTGTHIRVASSAVVYHRHGATSRTQPSGQKRFLMDRNAFWTLMKNYGESALRRTFGTALVLAIRRVLDEGTFAARAPLVRSLAPFVVRCRGWKSRTAWPSRLMYDDPATGRAATGSAATGRTPILSLPVEALGALHAAVAGLPRLAAARAAVQQRRTVSDREILPRFGRTLELVWPFSSYRRIQQALMEAQELPDVFRARTRLLIIGHEALARHMSGPAVRVLEMGRALSTVARVTIATPGVTEVDDPRCTFATYDPADPSGLRRLAEDADTVLVQGFTLAKFPFLKALHTPVIVDLYCPFTLEHLEQNRARLASGADPHGERMAAVQRDANGVLGVQNEQLLDGDFFICASEAQRDFWIGTLHTQGRINPLTYGDDPTLRRLIDVVPFGLPEISVEEAAARADVARGAGSAGQPVMKGVWPGIGPDDRVLLWAGSMLDWQDPLTLIRAVGELARTRPDVKLVFMGTRHPNPLVSPQQVVEESRALAARLGLTDTHVFFNDWVPYDQRALFLRESDLGLSTHRDHLETRFAFRTRMLDYIWAGLPIVCTRGDYFGALVESRGLGATVPPNDVSALAAALASLLDDSAAGLERRRAVRAQLEAIRDEMRWSRVVAPLARYCAQPYMAADRAPALREFRQRLAQQYGGAKWVKQTALRLGISEYQFERLKRSSLGRAAMSLHTRRAMQRAKRGS